MIIQFRALCALLFLFGASASATQNIDDSLPKSSAKTVVVIPLSGDVEPGMAAFLARALRDAKQHGDDALIVLEMDTYGGRVDAAFDIVDSMLTVPAHRSIAYVKTKAISAGALIALSCGNLYMRTHTTIGDVAPIMVSEKGPMELGEKFQSPLRAKFRILAKRNGYPVALTEAMVTKEISVFRVQFPDTTIYLDSAGLADLPAARKKTIVSRTQVVGSGELLTMDDGEAAQYGFSRKSVNSIEEMLKSHGVKEFRIIRMDQNWSEEFVRLLTRIAPILMMIGIAALYVEMRTPGFGVPGIIGVICLALVFFGQYTVGLADHTELLIIVLGFMLLAVEVFVTPGFGLIGLTGLALIGVGMVLSLQGFVLPTPSMPWQAREFTGNIIKVMGSLVGALVTSILFLRYLLPRIAPVVNGPYLMATLKDSHATPMEEHSVAVGDQGTVRTPLRPAGRVVFSGQVHDVVSQGEYIESGETVIATEVAANRIVVSRITA